MSISYIHSLNSISEVGFWIVDSNLRDAFLAISNSYKRIEILNFHSSKMDCSFLSKKELKEVVLSDLKNIPDSHYKFLTLMRLKDRGILMDSEILPFVMPYLEGYVK